MNELINITAGIVKSQKYPLNGALLELTDTKQTLICLNENEQDKIQVTFDNRYYDMSSEYIWTRSINFLRDKISVYGNDFIADMLGYNNFSSVKDISEEFIIDLSADIGFINQTARIKLKSISELLYHLQRREAVAIEKEELKRSDAISIISTCIDYVLGESSDSEFIPYVSMRKNLQSEILQANSNLIDTLVNSPYFYIRTITRTMINLANDENNPTLDITLQNTVIVLKSVWKKLDENERWYIGVIYSQAVSEGNVQLTKAIRTVLNSVKGFDYVPESTKSDTYRKTARHLLSKHNELNNFYTEPDIANLLANMGSSIPKAAIIECLTAVIICRLGNSYGISTAAITYLDNILDTISNENWVYFLNEIKTNSEILYELAYVDRNNQVVALWSDIVNKHGLHKLILHDDAVIKLVLASSSQEYPKVKYISRVLYNLLH